MEGKPRKEGTPHPLFAACLLLGLALRLLEGAPVNEKDEMSAIISAKDSRKGVGDGGSRLVKLEDVAGAAVCVTVFADKAEHAKS